MPAVLIEVRREYSEETEVALMEAVHAALCEAFRVPEHERVVRLVTHAPHRFACPQNLAWPERYTLVTIDCYPGRTLQAKRALYRAIVRNLEALDIPRDHVMVLLHESPPESWGIRGGQAGCDVQAGYSVQV